MGSFLDAYAPLFCSFVQQIEVRILKTYSNRQNFVQNKKQNRRPEPRKHTRDTLWLSWCFSFRFFRHYETFFENFWTAPKGPPSIFWCFPTELTFKNPKLSPFLARPQKGVFQAHRVIFLGFTALREFEISLTSCFLRPNVVRMLWKFPKSMLSILMNLWASSGTRL